MGLILKIAVAVLSLVGVILAIIAMGGNVGPVIGWTYFLFGLCTIAALAAALIGSLQKPKNLIVGIGGLVLLGILMAIGYGMSSGVDVLNDEGGIEVTASAARLSEMGLYTFYFLAFMAVAAVVYSSVTKMLK